MRPQCLVATLFTLLVPQIVALANLREWRPVHAERAYWTRDESNCMADGACPGWSLLLSPTAEICNAEMEFDVIVERAAPHSSNSDHASFVDYHAGRDNSGADFAVIVRYRDDDEFSCAQFSTRFSEVTLWSSSGGTLCVAPCHIEVEKKYHVRVCVFGGSMLVVVNGKEIARTTLAEPAAPSSPCAFGLGVYGSKTRFQNVCLASAQPLQPQDVTIARHVFVLRDWRGASWIFDGLEPVAFFDKKALVLWCVKLKPGFRPVLYWELFWKQYDGPHNYSDKIVKFDVLRQGEPELVLAWQSQDPSQRITTFAEMRVTYDESFQSYSYDVTTRMTVNPGKTWKNTADGLEYCNLIPYNVVGPATHGQTRQWPWWYRWVIYQDKAGVFKHPLTHNVIKYVTPKQDGGFYGYFGENPVNPVVFFDNPTDEWLRPYAGLCHWAHDIHFRYRPYADNQEIPSGTQHQARYRVVGFDAKRSEAVLTSAKMNPLFVDERVPVYVKGVNTFRYSRSGAEPHKEYWWRGGAWDQNVGHGDSFSLRLEGGKKGLDRSTVSVGGSNFMDTLQFGIYTLSAWLKAQDAEGTAEIGLQLNHPDEPPVFRRISLRGDSDWRQVRLVRYLPKRAGMTLILQFSGKGTVWFDDVELNCPNREDACLYEAERLSLHGQRTEVVSDPDATGGQAIASYVGKHQAGGWFFGPYSELEPPGEYVAYFRAKCAENLEAAPVMEVDVCDATGVLAKQTIRGKDFRAAGIYQYFVLPFRLAGVGQVQYRAVWHGKANCWMDHVGVLPRRELWAEDFSPPGARLDQAQFLQSGYHAAEKVGQTFMPQGRCIERIDLLCKNRTCTKPGIFRLWKWQGSYEKTIATKPLFEDALVLTGPDSPQTRRWLPRVDVTPGETYFFETEKRGQAAGIIYVDQDLYPGGCMFSGGVENSTRDLLFFIYTSDGGPITQSVPLPPRPVIPVTLPASSPPLSIEAPVSKADYLETVQKYVQANFEQWARADGKHAHTRAFLYAFLYKATGDTRHVRDGVTQFHAAAQWRKEHPGEPVGFGWLPPACLAYKWIRENNLLTAEDHALIRNLLLDSAQKHWSLKERGAMNRSAGSMLGYSLMAKLFPDNPMSAQWRQYAEQVWNDWFSQRDTEEDSLHYHALWWDYIITYAHENGIDIFSDPGVKKLITRFREQASPLGPLPPYGDCYGWGFEWGGYVLLFEKAASAYRDGTFKWAAHRIFDYHRRHVKNQVPWLATYEDIPHLALAYLHTDDSVVPQAPPANSVLLTRKGIEMLPVEERRREQMFARLLPDETPDKLILRTRPDGGLFTCFNLAPSAGHGHQDASSLICMTNDKTVLLTDTCYEDRLPEEHSQVVIKMLRGSPVTESGTSHTVVEHFFEHPTATFATFRTKDYSGCGAQKRRQILYVKDRLLWVRDVVEFTHAMEVSVGPVWRVGELLPERGENWFDAAWHEPRGFHWLWRNGDDRLLVFFLPQTSAEVNYEYEPWRTARAPHQWSPPWALYQKRSRVSVTPGTRIHFNTVLLPHKRDANPGAIAKSLVPVYDDVTTTAIKVHLPESELLMHIGEGKNIVAGPLQTDAMFLLLDLSSRHLTAEDCSRVILDARPIFTADERRSVEKKID